MRRLAVIGFASALSVTGAAFAAGDVSGVTPTRPYIRLVDTEPLAIRGVNFRPDARVTVVATVNERSSARILRHSRSTQTGNAGGFTVVLTGVSAPACDPWSVSATDTAGNRATIKIVPQCGALP